MLLRHQGNRGVRWLVTGISGAVLGAGALVGAVGVAAGSAVAPKVPSAASAAVDLHNQVWAGYAVRGEKSYTSVTGSFMVPTKFDCNADNLLHGGGQMSLWVGLGGMQARVAQRDAAPQL